jgi:four helix bundle protein
MVKYGYKKLDVWTASLKYVVEIYSLTKKFPKDEDFGLKSQLRRAAVSIPTNISEGYGRDSKQELVRYINIAKGSANEIDTLLTISKDLEYISVQQFTHMTDKIDHINRMLFKLKESLQKRTDATRKTQKRL